MIIYLHGFDSNSPGNHEKIMQLKFIDDDVRFINYSTLHPRYDMQFLLNEVHKLVSESKDSSPLICGVGLGGYWAERIGFLCGIKQAIFNPNLFPYENMQGRIDRPEEYQDIATKCVENFRVKNQGNCLVFLSTQDEVLDSQRSANVLSPFYEIVWDDNEGHKFKKISQHLQQIRAFKTA
ncbi:alpha/beta hydrolase YcfP [Avibacterium paragallinarum]|uniref:Alpha/beta hydrolase YcfP n=1 Tax=Avibacterium paragallinarum TaxID=728 RepID=A0AAE5TJP1_AVIPA|nr:alpha/beta hydrolase YcfP [Avibacterium paragallinarum]MEE3608057.1 alpha/beta hydrolase YcfP [Avibacterium paragallinarum]MEE3621009.1 alpha/beta hydrolase YcfP [Avibacterium paragallinarum]MEE3668263.1 alpha/beta hydrolase YcfP [Avibacterium paragallinarum]MEE3680542.1 alpha/beta hydrolase YcfP [Avibacterium paragallinarum]MEE4385604.1 alpha/beta hydrolase YcfP [Avibacterium paragallinarum]